MHLKYKIEFSSTNAYIKNIINDLINQCNVNASCEQYEDFLLISIDENEEKIQSFFKFLETSLPLSIYIKKAYVVENIDERLIPLQNSFDKQSVAISMQQIMDIYQESNDYEVEAKTLKNGEIIRFMNSNGLKDLSIPNASNAKELGEDLRVLIINLNALHTLFKVNQRDIHMLSSIERPLVKLEFLLMENKENDFGESRFIQVKLPEDEATYKLATSLRKEGVDFLIYKDYPLQEDMHIMYDENRTWIVKGNRALFPKYDFIAQRAFETVKEYFDFHGSVFNAMIKQNKKENDAVIGVYFSTIHDSFIGVYTPVHGIKQIIKIPNIFNDFQTCLEDIRSIDDSSKRLIENYEMKFPEVFKNEPIMQQNNTFQSIIEFASYLLGFQGVWEFEEKAYQCSAKSGMKVDFNVIKIDAINYLDYRKTIQSMLSYKMADVQESLIAYSFFESLNDFIVQNVTKINSELKTTDIVICGDLFANRVLFSKTIKSLSSFEIITPTEYPFDY